MATTEMIRAGGPEGAPREHAHHQSLAGGSSIEDGGMHASIEAQSQHAQGNDGRLGLEYASGEQFE